MKMEFAYGTGGIMTKVDLSEIGISKRCAETSHQGKTGINISNNIPVRGRASDTHAQ
jgi:hypothetical protein